MDVVSYQLRMALIPDVHLNFGQVTFERIYQIFLPLVPGGTLVGGLMLANPGKAHTVATTLGLGPYSRFALLACAVYIVGLVLYGFSVAVTAWFSILLSSLVGRWWPSIRKNETSSRSTMWRRVAAQLLGTLTPPAPLPPAPALSGNDVEWQDYYNVLQDYVLRGKAVIVNELLLLFTYLEAVGWALLYLYFRTPLRTHWSPLVVSVTVILFGSTYPFVTNLYYFKYDRLTPWNFTARLINEIRTSQQPTPPAHI